MRPSQQWWIKKGWVSYIPITFYQINFSPSKGKKIKEVHPGLVVSNNIQNEYGHYIIVAPITSTLKRERLFEKAIAPSKENGLEKKSKILLNQIRSIDKKRIIRYYGQVETEIMTEVKNKLQLVLDLATEIKDE